MNRIKELRIQNDLSQAEFAAIFDINQTAVSQWERDITAPSINMLKRIVDYFDITMDFLLDVNKSKTMVPVLGSVHAGMALEAIEEIIDYEEITPRLARLGNFFALHIEGDCMEPRLHEGDVVIIRQQSSADNGDVVVALIKNEDAVVRKLSIKDNGIMLIPTNSKYEPMFYTNDEVANLPVTILGCVVEVRVKLKLL